MTRVDQSFPCDASLDPKFQEALDAGYAIDEEESDTNAREENGVTYKFEVWRRRPTSTLVGGDNGSSAAAAKRQKVGDGP